MGGGFGKETNMSSLITRDPLEDFFRGFFVRPVEFGTSVEIPSMRVDVHEDAQHYTVHAELPGMKKEDIHVHVEGGAVSISAKRRQETETREGDKVLHTERSFGEVSRSFQLGADVDEIHASAKYVDGVLELSLPKKAISQAKRLKIE